MKDKSRLLVVAERETGKQYLIDFFKYGVPDGFSKVTGSLPTAEKYFDLPVYGETEQEGMA